MRTVWDIIKSPVITEKALLAKELTEDGKQLLTFRVDRHATKPEIKSAVESIFQVKVHQVRTLNYMGKMARRGRHEGRKPSWKKAYVTLKGRPGSTRLRRTNLKADVRGQMSDIEVDGDN